MKQIDRDFFRGMVSDRAEVFGINPLESVDTAIERIGLSLALARQLDPDENGRRLDYLVEIAALCERAAVDVPNCSTRNKVEALTKSSAGTPNSARETRALPKKGKI